MAVTLVERLASKIDYSGPCWLWIGAGATTARYGSVRVAGRTLLAHRVMFAVARGPIPPGLDVLHACDNGHCVHPGHLFLGTHQDNMDDRQRKGRGVNPPQPTRAQRARGERHGNARLTDAQVGAIRELCGQGVLQRDVAQRMGTTQGNVSKIMRGASRHGCHA